MSEAPQRKIIPGVKMNLGGDDYIIPPLNLYSLEILQKKIEGLPDALAASGGLPNPEQMKDIVEIFLHAAQRNYPELTAADAMKFIDVGNIIPLFQAVMNVSGVQRAGE